MSKHTQGPWRAHFYATGDISIDAWPAGIPGVAVADVMLGMPRHEAEANAAVLAAAPDLLRVLCVLAPFVRAEMERLRHPAAPLPIEALLEAEQLLAKLEGGQS